MKKSKIGFALLLSTALAAGTVPPATASVPEGSPSSSSAAGPESASAHPGDAPAWLGSWNAAMTPSDEPGTVSGDGFTDTTLRQSVHLSIGGDSVRLRISNAYGTTPLEVGAVSVAPGDASSEINGAQLTRVTFSGSTSTTIPAGADWVSDPIPLAAEPNSDLVVSMHLPGPTGPATTHPLGMSTSYRADGDRTSADTSQFSPLDEGRYFLSGVDVASSAKGSVVFFGDSITDGHSSTVDGNLRYPDQVADRLLERPVSQQCGVINSGISGNRLLSDAGPEGVSAMARFDSDVLARQDVDTVVLLEGINDIGQSDGEVPAADLIEVYQQFVNRSRDHGLRVVGATLTPYTGADYATESGEATRQEVNDWIRNSGEFDDVIDFDATLRDPAAPEQILPGFDPGDHLHPNDEGYTAMADAVELDAIC